MSTRQRELFLLFSALFCASAARGVDWDGNPYAGLKTRLAQEKPVEASRPVRAKPRGGYRRLLDVLPKLELLRGDITRARILEIKAAPQAIVIDKSLEGCYEPGADAQRIEYCRRVMSQTIRWATALHCDGKDCLILDRWQAEHYPNMINAMGGAPQLSYGLARGQLEAYHQQANASIARSRQVLDSVSRLLKYESGNPVYNSGERAVLADLTWKWEADSPKRAEAEAAVLAAHDQFMRQNAGTSIVVAISSSAVFIKLMSQSSDLLKEAGGSVAAIVARIHDLNEEAYGDYRQLKEEMRDSRRQYYVSFGGADDRSWLIARRLQIDLPWVAGVRVGDDVMKRRLIADAKKDQADKSLPDDYEVAGILYGFGGTSPKLVTYQEASDYDKVLEISNRQLESK